MKHSTISSLRTLAAQDSRKRTPAAQRLIDALEEHLETYGFKPKVSGWQNISVPAVRNQQVWYVAQRGSEAITLPKALEAGPRAAAALIKRILSTDEEEEENDEDQKEAMGAKLPKSDGTYKYLGKVTVVDPNGRSVTMFPDQVFKARPSTVKPGEYRVQWKDKKGKGWSARVPAKALQKLLSKSTAR